MTQRTIPKILRSTACAVVLLLAAQAIHAQIGGNVDLTWHILSSGGTSASTGDTVTVGGSLGQFGPGSSSGGGVALVGGFWNPASSAPLAVTLAGFSAVQQGDSVLLTWETASELNNRGFNLYRGVDPSGPDRQLNAALIPSQSPGSSGGYAYTWEDRADLAPGVTYFYWLEDVDIHGAATMHGPVSVDFSAPAAVQLAGLAASSAPGFQPGWPVGLAALLAVLMAGTVVGWRRSMHRQ
jgi:hypothetical protein